MDHAVLPSPWAPHGLGCRATPRRPPPVHPGPSVPTAGTQRADLPQAAADPTPVRPHCHRTSAKGVWKDRGNKKIK